MNTKRLLSTVLLLLITLSLLLAACAPAVPATPAKDLSDSVTVVQTFYELYNANKIDEAMALTAEDYVMNDPFGTYDRAAAAVQYLAGGKFD